MASEHKQPYPILRVETISEYLACVPGKARTMLRNLEDGNYCVEVDPGKWIRVVSIPVELMAGIAWTPRIPAPVEPAAVSAAPEPVAAAEDLAPLSFDPFDVVMADNYGYERVVIPVVEPTPAPAVVEEPVVDPYEWIGKPQPDDMPAYTGGDDDDPFDTRGPGRPDVPAIPAQHATDLQADRDAEYAANMARINREMAEAADAAPAVEMNTGLVGRQRKPGEENLM